MPAGPIQLQAQQELMRRRAAAELARRRGLLPTGVGNATDTAAPLPDSQPGAPSPGVNQASMGGGMLSGAMETVKNIPGSAAPVR